jgi:hypothetical protein
MSSRGTLRLLRKFRERGVTVVSVQESWLDGSSEAAARAVLADHWESEDQGIEVITGVTRVAAHAPGVDLE